jgi:hypothetical protein
MMSARLILSFFRCTAAPRACDKFDRSSGLLLHCRYTYLQLPSDQQVTEYILNQVSVSCWILCPDTSLCVI